ncbi:MAG: UDP-N-acetylmuramate dehydrogenase [Phycisphaerae bacterium]
MDWLSKLGGPIERDVPLAEMTWFGLGGPARFLARPNDDEQLGRVLDRASQQGQEVKVLGRGANILVSDNGFDGLVVRLDSPAFGRTEQQAGRVVAGAGVDLMRLVRTCSRKGLAGLEQLAGIPGTVGGAIRMNAGGRYGEIGDAVEWIEVLDVNGQRRRLDKSEVGFGYRRTALGDVVITAACFGLEPADPDEVYRRFLEYWRTKKASQPMADHSAGCIFTNPPGDSAGRIIDRAGLKGRRCGRARVSERHANFIVADKGAKADDVLRLIDQVRTSVLKQFGTLLQLEIDVWGRAGKDDRPARYARAKECLQ